MATARLDWSTAKVRDGRLTVKIAGDPPDGWKDAFNTTAALLGGRDLGNVELRKRVAHVDGVTPGSEERTRHLLESVVQQANSALDATADEEDPEQQEHEEDGGESPDAEMTKRFRSFAAEDEQER